MKQQNRTNKREFNSLDPISIIPLYYQLKEAILEKIELQEWPEGSLIPSESELQKIFNISRATVRRTMDVLVNEGYLVRKKGIGSFVKNSKIEEFLPTLTSFTEEMIDHEATKKVLTAEYIKPLPKIREILQASPGENIFFLKRLMIVDNIPLGILYEYIPGRFNLSLENDYTKSLYRIFSKCGIPPKKADQTIEASISTPEEIKFMKLKKRFPTLLIRRVVSTTNSEIIEYVKGVYHGNRYRYQLKLYRDKPW